MMVAPIENSVPIEISSLLMLNKQLEVHVPGGMSRESFQRFCAQNPELKVELDEYQN